MATPTLKVITEYCNQYIDDFRLKELAVTNPALYARKMYGLFRIAIPLFTCPKNMILYLLGDKQSPKFTEAKYDSLHYTANSDFVTDIKIALGNAYAGYEVFCCQLITTDDFGNILTQTINNASYDATNGEITISANEENPIPYGTEFEIDFYTDGFFDEDLSSEIMAILGKCFQVAWRSQFNEDALSLIAKIEDKSFFEQNRANKERADTERLDSLLKQLAADMSAYETNLYYRKYVPNTKGIL